ncbi:MAG: hypothetical protein ACUVRY_05895 [Thermoanaerobaculaceae bacterium]
MNLLNYVQLAEKAGSGNRIGDGFQLLRVAAVDLPNVAQPVF